MSINESEVRSILNIMEKLYSLEIKYVAEKLENIKRINIDSLMEFVEYNKLNDASDLIQYVQGIIQD